MDRSKLSMKWLEVFQAVARTGAVREAALILNISVSTASHHLSCLEEAVGVPLIDHDRRPMRPTTEGEIFLRRVDEAMGLLRKGMLEVWSQDPGTLVRALKIASIEDLDARVTPALAAGLSRTLRSCDVSFLSRPSHDVLTLLQSEEIDIGIASNSEFSGLRLAETPILRDPYVLVVPRNRDDPAKAYLTGTVDLPFLRYSKKQLIGRRVEAQLRRLRLDLPSRLEFESTPALLSLVSEGQAWTITTALNLSTGYSYAERIHVMPFPDAGFARTLSMFCREDLPKGLIRLVETTLKSLIESRIVSPAVARTPWLNESFKLLID